MKSKLVNIRDPFSGEYEQAELLGGKNEELIENLNFIIGADLQFDPNWDLAPFFNRSYKPKELPHEEILPKDFIDRLYRNFKRFKLKGRVALSVPEKELISIQDCKHIDDDLVYDKQQYQQYFSKRTWEEFDLSDAAFLIGYPFVAPIRDRYSALPYMAELILRSQCWFDAFSSFMSRIVNDLKEVYNTDAKEFYDEYTSKDILWMLLAFKCKLLEIYEDEYSSAYTRMEDIDKAIDVLKNRLFSPPQS